ncbi:MAG: hypothetical protein M0P73_19190 [Syntrophobacterales bacterium]|jgi:hypothetical protein|nr:hypothetical protein [Syntrophobacterales bacterium]
MGKDKGQKRNKPFVMVPKDMLHSPAWESLSNPARVAWLHIALDQRSKDDQHLKLPYSQAGRLMDRKTFTVALRELQAKGFITVTKHGGLRGAGEGKSDCAEYGLSSGWRNWHPPKGTVGKKSRVENHPEQGVEIHPDKGFESRLSGGKSTPLGRI